MIQKNKQAGFTLVELLVSIIVGGIIIASLSQVVNSYINVSKNGRYLNLANSFAEAKIEALRNAGYNNIATGTTNLTAQLPAQLPPGKTASMEVTTPYGGIKKIVLTVSYKEQSKIKTYSYATYVGELGVGQ